MATKSFLKEISIKNKKSANSFLSALENAERKGRKKIIINASVKSIKVCRTRNER